MYLNEFSKQLLSKKRAIFDQRSFLERSETKDQLVSQKTMENISNFNDVHKIIGNESRTVATLADIFWQVLVQSKYYKKNLLEGLEIPDPVLNGGRMILSMTNLRRPRYDLLILTPQMPEGGAFSVSIKDALKQGSLTGENLAYLYMVWLNIQKKELEETSEKLGREQESYQQIRDLLKALSAPTAYNFMHEAIENEDFAILFGPMPRTTLSSAIVKPGCAIALQHESRPISSAGIVTTDKFGRNGVTASLHGVFNSPEELDQLFNQMGRSCALNKTVYVNGKKGTIVAADYLTDSCFIEVDTQELSMPKSIKGPLRSRSPYQGEQVYFESYSASSSTVVTEVDIGITSVIRNRQVRVYTRPVTNPGDSGSALFNQDDYVLGFNHARTGLGEGIEFAEWIWADSVFNALEL